MPVHRCACGRETSIDERAPDDVSFCPRCGAPIARVRPPPFADPRPRPSPDSPPPLPTAVARTPRAPTPRPSPPPASIGATGAWLLHGALFLIGVVGAYFVCVGRESPGTSTAALAAPAADDLSAAVERPSIEVLSARRSPKLVIATAKSAAKPTWAEPGLTYLILDLSIPEALGSPSSPPPVKGDGSPDRSRRGVTFETADFRLLDDDGKPVSAAPLCGGTSDSGGDIYRAYVARFSFTAASDEGHRQKLAFAVRKQWQLPTYLRYREEKPVAISEATDR